jgi:hypothetical protein
MAHVGRWGQGANRPDTPRLMIDKLPADETASRAAGDCLVASLGSLGNACQTVPGAGRVQAAGG